ncbi:MAG: Magnesium transporter MgtE [Verrucomicrobiales bacterium]|nr:Magnesium transporter MgtE [Verrucomicrobiales bacterium]
MEINGKPQHLDEPVQNYVHKGMAVLHQDMTAGQALAAIRTQKPSEAIVYFYVVDSAGKLVGVLPTRRLLIADLEQPISEITVRRVVTIPHTATLAEACEFFVLYKFLAFPVVDDQHRFLGTLDVNLFTEEVFDLAERERVDDVFETIGFRISQLKGASPFKAFTHRFPWLLATMTSGVLCALISGAFETTLAKSVVLAFFLALVLGLGESVSIQSVSLAIQSLHSKTPTWRWYFNALGREVAVGVLLGLAGGMMTFLIVWLWRGTLLSGIVVGSTVAFSFVAACTFGISIPTALHALKLDPKIAAGPITLAVTDVFSLLFYFTLAKIVL